MMNQVFRSSSLIISRSAVVRYTTTRQIRNLGPSANADSFRSFSTAEEVKGNGMLSTGQQPNVIKDGAAIQVNFTKGTVDGKEATESYFHAPWLWYSDPTYIHPSSGQRLRRLGQFPGWKIASGEIVDLETAMAEETTSCTFPHPAPPPGFLHSIGTVYNTKISETEDLAGKQLLKIVWDTGADSSPTESSDTKVSYYDWNWLRRCRYDDKARRERAQKTRITSQNALGRLESCHPIVEVSYSDLFPREDSPFTAARKDTLLRVLHAVAEQGAVLIRGAPLGSFLHYAPESNDDNDDDHQAAVAKVGRAMSGGALSHGALYGDLFHVRSIPKALNIAYTTVALSPHQDLAYFESKPGMQLLHCIRNQQDQIRGGESLLIDSIAAAESLRLMEPHYFHTLCRSYATFHKQREGADMVYNRPHIVLGDMGQVVAVHWSPPFEAPPMGIPEDEMEAYLEAYAAFERMLDDQLFPSSSQTSAMLPPSVDAKLHQYAKDYTWERSLEPGDMLVFNNQRMLHGRRGFELLHPEKEHGDSVYRHLAGCYTNIDDTINTYRVLLRDLPDRDERTVRGFGNGSGGSF